MRTSTEKNPRLQDDRDREPPTDSGDELRDFETQVSDDDRNYDAPIGPDGEPIDEEPINTDGSER